MRARNFLNISKFSLGKLKYPDMRIKAYNIFNVPTLGSSHWYNALYKWFIVVQQD
jgi:hypothetical protein